MAASLALKFFIVSTFLNLLTRVTLYIQTGNLYAQECSVHESCWIDRGWLSFNEIWPYFADQLLPHNVGPIIYYESNFKSSRAVSKSTKHGYTCLTLPTKPFKTDLTICVDVSPNTGPDNSKRNTCDSTKLSSKCVSSCLSKIDTCNVYKLSILRSLRSSPFSKYIDKSLHNCLISLRILRPFRGCRSWKRVKERKAYLRDVNIRVKYDGQIYISCNQNNTPTYNLSSYFPISTQNSTDIIPESINTRNLNNLILMTPNNPSWESQFNLR